MSAFIVDGKLRLEPTKESLEADKENKKIFTVDINMIFQK